MQPILYPPLAIQARIAGGVVLRVFVASDGRVSHVEELAGHPLLKSAAQAAVKRWTFAPVSEEHSFELSLNFDFRGSDSRKEPALVTGPLRVLVLTDLPTIALNVGQTRRI